MQQQSNITGTPQQQQQGPSLQETPPQMPFMPPFVHPSTPLTSHQPQMPFDPSQMPFMDPNQMGWNDYLTMMMMSTPFPESLMSTPASVSSGNDSGIFLSPEENSPPGVEPDFQKIQGRLNLNNNPRQYSITKAEIERRLSHPEYMNSSTLAAYMRKAKVKEGGPQMRQELAKKGILLNNQSRKRGCAPTCFSALLEEEAILMGNELDSLAKTNFPKEQFATVMIQQALQNGMHNELTELGKEAMYAARFLNRFGTLTNNVKVSVGKYNYKSPEDPLHNQMALFSALTHGFGLVNHKTWVQVFEQIACETQHRIQLMGTPIM